MTAGPFHHMYVVECADGTWYTGYAVDVARRVATHNAGRGAKYTRARLPVELVASAAFKTKHEAMGAEFRFKRLSRAQKASLVCAACSEQGACDSAKFAAVLREAFCLDAHPTADEVPSTIGETLVNDTAVIRTATSGDLDAIAAVEAACFPPAEAASREQFAERLATYADHFWLMELEERVVSVVNGMVSDEPLIRDEMFEDAGLHDEAGDWQLIFGVMTLPEYQGRGLASRVMERAIADARAQGRRGCVLTCKEALVGFYERFGYVNLGVSASVHGGATWYDMRLEF